MTDSALKRILERMNVRLQFGVVVVVIVQMSMFSGCSRDRSASQDSASARIDSAGVTIITNSSARWTDDFAWSISDDPVLEIGTLEGEPAYLFQRISGATKLPNGSIVGADDVEVRIFDADGASIRTMGARGEGPGEYRYIRHIKLCAEGEFRVYDLSWKQSRYTLEGDFIGTKNVLPEGLRPYTLSCTPSGAFVSMLWSDSVRQLTIGLFDTESFLVVNYPEGRTDTLMTLPGGQRLGHEFGSGPHPFGRKTSIATTNDQILITDGRSFEVRSYDLEGELLRIVRLPTRNRIISNDDLALFAETEAMDADPERYEAVLEENLSIEMPDRYPAYGAMIVDSAQHVWLAHHVRPGDQATRWDILDPQGRFLGTLEVDRTIEITQIGIDFILGNRVNEEGVPQIVKWRLTR